MSAAALDVRADLRAGHADVWEHLAAPGTWWTGAERVAIAGETRRARNCTLCRERKATVSPHAVAGEHDGGALLPAVVVDAVHRIATDPGRLTRALLDGFVAGGLSDAHYVETIAVVVQTVAVDVFCRAVGQPLHPLPAPRPGAPSRERPAEAELEGAWVPMIPQGVRRGPGAELYGKGVHPNVARALSLVLAEARMLRRLVVVEYVPIHAVADPGYEIRAITRAQMELVAARVSALNECFY